MNGGEPRPLLRRSTSDRVIAGVAGGLGQYLGVDPVLLRIAFVVLAFTGSGVLLYIIGWIVMPEAGEDAQQAVPPPAAAGSASRIIVGGVLIAAGTLLLIDRIVPWFDKVLLPAVLIAIGAGIVVYGARK